MDFDPAPAAHAEPPPGDFSLDFDPPAPAAPPRSFDFADLPTPAAEAPPSDFSMDFDPPPEPAPAPSSDRGFDFADLPSPAGAPPPPQSEPAPPGDFGFDFADLPSPAGGPPPAADFIPPSPKQQPESDPAGDFSLDFTDLPQPGDPYAAAPVPSAPQSMAAPAPATPIDYSANFGEVDFGDPSPAPGAASPGFDDLEFDPTRAPPRATDDLEVDLSAPLPPPKPAGATDGLEMLSFIDDSAKAAGAEKTTKKRFHVRRRSGKVFGPFEEGVVVKMLEDGQLLGNEDVSTDSESWSAIGTVPAFADALQKLMESPTGTFTAPGGTPNDAKAQTNSAETMERLKNLYEGRMAAVAVVDRRAESQKFKKRLPLLIAGVVVLVIAAAGGALSMTRYGAFGLKVLMPARVDAGTPAFTQLEAARKALLSDTFKSYTEAKELTAGILRAKELPEVRAAWSQSVFYLQRRYNAATPDEVRRAKEAQPHLRLLGEKHPEVVKALAGEALGGRRYDEARLLLQDGAQRHPADLEMRLLLAEAWIAQSQTDFAVQALEGVLERDETSAKALHALGVLTSRAAEKLANAGKREEAQEQGKKAEALFERALASAPEHVISAVELAGIQLLVLKDAQAGLDALEKALTEEATSLMGPAEIARAHALNGAGLAMKFKVDAAIAEFEKALELDPDAVFAKAQLGRIYLSQREFARAVPLFKEASSKEPSNLDYTDGYLTVLVGTGKMQDALNVLQTATAQFPDTPRITYLDARVNDALDNALKAEENYKRALEQDEALFEANLHLGRLYLRQKRLADARTQMEEAYAKAPDGALVNVGMGEVLLAEEQAAQAKEAFERAVKKDPLLPDAYLGLSRTSLLDGDLDGAEAQVTRALELDPRLGGAFHQKGIILWKKGDLPGAVAALEEGRKNEPSNAKLNVTLGAVKLDMNDLTGAEAALLAALTVESRNHEANFYRARVKSRRLEHTGAIESMRAALEAAPKNAAYHYEMGIIYREAKKPQEAQAQWKEAIALDPGFADAMEALGQAHLDKGEFKEAILQFESALRVDPTRARLLAAMGDAYFQSAEWDMAIRRYQQALKADGKLIALNYKVARALSEQGKSAEAVSWYRKATSAEPENAMPWYYLGYLYKERRQRGEAITAFTRYLEKKPDAADKREIEDEIYDLKQGI